ncbi:MAG: Spy/CpxP family protein refolding chaperone [Cyanobacteria bacterium P01_A01_bin.123]
MKRQLSLLLSGVVGVMALASVALAQHHAPISAQKATEGHISMTKQMGGGNMDKIEELDLTPEQEEEIDTIQAGMSEQMAEILTFDQLAALEDAQANGGNMRSVFMSLDSNQRSEVMTLMRTTQDEIMAVLTPEQRAQIEGELPRDRN